MLKVPSTHIIFSPLYAAAVSDTIGTKWSSDLRPISIGPFTETPGPVNQLHPNATTMELFSLFWETSFFDRLAEETNLYAQQRQANQTRNGIPPLQKK